jgi:hypothetical protein
VAGYAGAAAKWSSHLLAQAQGGEPADLVHAIRVIAAGDALLAPSVTRKLIDAYASRRQPHTVGKHDGLFGDRGCVPVSMFGAAGAAVMERELDLALSSELGEVALGG